jgi:hypothetical protein
LIWRLEKGVSKEDRTEEIQTEEISDPERCTRQLVLIVEENAKFHSNPQRAGPSTVETALPRREDFSV